MSFLRYNICIPHFWYPQCDITVHVFPKYTKIIPPLWLIAVGWSWQMLNCFFWFSSVLQRHKQRCPFFPSLLFFGATSLVLQQTLFTIYTMFHKQPSCCTF